MSRLSEILGVKEGQEFRYGNKERTYKVVDEFFYMKKDRYDVFIECANIPVEMIAHPELIHPIPEKPQLTEQQITAIKGRIAEGTPWAAKDDEGNMIKFFINEPHFSKKYEMFMDEESMKINPLKLYDSSSFNDIYNFITDINSLVYLPELVEGSEQD